MKLYLSDAHAAHNRSKVDSNRMKGPLEVLLVQRAGDERPLPLRDGRFLPIATGADVLRTTLHILLEFELSIDILVKLAVLCLVTPGATAARRRLILIRLFIIIIIHPTRDT